MNAQTQSAAPKEFRLFLELVLVVGLPLLAVFVGSALAIVAYTKGFTALPETPAIVVHHR